MKRVNNFTKGDDPNTCLEHDVSHGKVGKKSEFSKKKPLPSIEKDPAFADSVLSAATMHIRHKTREPNGPNTTKPQCPGQVLGPRTRDVPRPGPGRRTPPIPPGPGPTQGPSGDLPTRKTVEGTHKRDTFNQLECHQQRQLLLNPPWRATCAVVEPTQAGNICFDRLPRGLKQLKPVDLCYRHGHRRRLHNTLEESQRTEMFLRRGRAAVQHRTHGSKQRGDVNSDRANIGKTVFNTVGEEECRRPDNDVSNVGNSVEDKDTLDVSFILTVGCMAVEDSLETPGAAPPPDQSESMCVDCSFDKDDSMQASLAAKEGILPQSIECKIDFSGDAPSVSPRKTSGAVTSQDLAEKTETDEMISNLACTSEVEPGVSDMEPCRVTPSGPSLVVRAESLVSCRAVVGRLHTDVRPKSFAALTDKEREKGNMAVTNFNLQPLTRKDIKKEDCSDRIEDSKPPVCVIAATDHPDVDGNWDGTEDCQRDTGFHVAETIGASCDESSPAVTAVNQLGTSPNLNQTEAGSVCDCRSPSCEIKVEGAQEIVPSAITGEPHAPMQSELDLEEIQDATQISRIQRAEPSSDSLSKETQKDAIQEVGEAELLTFSVKSSKVTGNRRAAKDMAVTKYSPAENFESQDGQTEDFDGADSQQNDSRSQDDDRAVLPRSDRQEFGHSVRKSRAEVDPSPDLQPPTSCHDIAIGIRFFKTPDNETKSPVSNVESENHPIGGEPFSLKNDRSSVQSGSDLNPQTEKCTIRKIASQDNAGKSKYIVLPDQDIVVTGTNTGSARSPGIERHELISQSYSQENISAGRSLTTSSEFPMDSSNFTNREKSVSHSCSAAFRQDTVDRSSVVGIKRVGAEKHSKQAINDAERGGKTEDDQEIGLQRKEKIRTANGRKARTKTGCEIYPIHEDEEKDARRDSYCKDCVMEDDTMDKGVYHDLSVVKEEEEKEGEDGKEEEDWFPPFVSPLPRAAAGGRSSGPPLKHAQQKRVNFGAAESNRFFRIHGSNLQGDGPWGQGDRIERPGNYVEPTVSLEDMSTRFFTDTTPLDLAFNAVNVVNSCSNSISFHSCHNQKRLLAALDGLRSDDVYKHALICPLARQCAAATREFSLSLHKVFRRYSNRARAAQEALIEYYRALASGEITSPEMQRQIQRDGRRLYMVWEGGRYVTRYADGTTSDSDISPDSSTVQTTRPSRDQG